jgi:hypothetical protein
MRLDSMLRIALCNIARHPLVIATATMCHVLSDCGSFNADDTAKLQIKPVPTIHCGCCVNAEQGKTLIRVQVPSSPH